MKLLLLFVVILLVVGCTENKDITSLVEPLSTDVQSLVYADKASVPSQVSYIGLGFYQSLDQDSSINPDPLIPYNMDCNIQQGRLREILYMAINDQSAFRVKIVNNTGFYWVSQELYTGLPVVSARLYVDLPFNSPLDVYIWKDLCSTNEDVNISVITVIDRQ